MRVFLIQMLIPTYRRAVFRRLSQNEHMEFSIIAGEKSAEPLRVLQGDELKGIRHRLAATRIIGLGKLKFTWQPEALRLVRHERPDVIIVHGGFYDLTSWAILLWGRFRGATVLSWGHGLKRPERGPKWWLRRLFNILPRGLLLYGDYAKTLLTNKGLDPSRMHVIYNSLDDRQQILAAQAVDPSCADRLRQRYEVNAAAGCLVFIGRFTAKKSLDQIIHAVARLRNCDRDIHAFFVGDGPETKALKQLASDQGVSSRIHFTGPLYDEFAVAPFMELCQASVVPEFAGLSIMHAMGYGLPVIISDSIDDHNPEWEAVRDGETGYFYKRNDVADLARKIEACLFGPVDSRRFGNNCRTEIAERYSSDIHARRIIEAVTRFSN